HVLLFPTVSQVGGDDDSAAVALVAGRITTVIALRHRDARVHACVYTGARVPRAYVEATSRSRSGDRSYGSVYMREARSARSRVTAIGRWSDSRQSRTS